MANIYAYTPLECATEMALLTIAYRSLTIHFKRKIAGWTS